MKPNSYLPMALICPTCGGECGINIRLLEFLEAKAIEMDIADLSDIDALVKEAIEGKHEHKAHFKDNLIVVPFALDLTNKQLVMMVFCSKCNEVKICGLTPQELQDLLEGEP